MLIIKKTDGISIANQESIFRVAKKCLEDYQKGHDVVIVLSLQNSEIKKCMAQAKLIHPNPPAREMDMLLSAQEQKAAAFLAIAFEALETPVVSFNAFQTKIQTTGTHGDAKITGMDTECISQALSQRKIVIVTGMQGINEKGDITTFDIDGKNQSVAALAAALRADICTYYKEGKEILEEKEAVA